MASIKAKKGNPFEYNTLYSLATGGYNVIRMDDNSEGIDLVIFDSPKSFIECKRHKGFSWNELVSTYKKTKNQVKEDGKVFLIFKANRQPTLCFFEDRFNNYVVKEFKVVFGCEWNKRPKGWKIFKK